MDRNFKSDSPKWTVTLRAMLWQFIILHRFNKRYKNCIHQINHRNHANFVRCVFVINHILVKYCDLLFRLILYVVFIAYYSYRVTSQTPQGKGLVHEWPKSALFNILIKTLVNISQHGTSSKTTTTSLKTNHYGCYGNNNTLHGIL